MNITKKELKEMAAKSQNRLFIAVVNDLLEIPAADLVAHIKDVLQYGCINGTVSNMIYYSDTLKFYEDYKEEIAHLLSSEGFKPSDLKDFDNEDPFILEKHNKNLLAWFGYEQTLYQLACYFGY